MTLQDRAGERVIGAAGRVRVPKTAELVASQLRRRIVRGELVEGDALPPESVLLEQFGVSRPTLREAFRVLESEALITVRRGSQGGARVQTPDGDVAARYAGLVLEYRGTTLDDVFEAAAVIEAPCVGLLARNRTQADLKLLREAVEREEAAGDPSAVLEAQVALHQLVIQLSGNQTLKILAEMVRHIIDTASRKTLEREGPSARQTKATHKGSRTHRQLLQLVEARDAVAAEDLWRRHVNETSKYLQQSLGTQTLLDLLD